jgi:hypothetical protein
MTNELRSPPMETDQKTPGQVLYEAYWQRNDAARWGILSAAGHAVWENVAAAVLAAHSPDTARLNYLMAHGSRLTDRAEIDHAMEHGDDE